MLYGNYPCQETEGRREIKKGSQKTNMKKKEEKKERKKKTDTIRGERDRMAEKQPAQCREDEKHILSYRERKTQH